MPGPLELPDYFPPFSGGVTPLPFDTTRPRPAEVPATGQGDWFTAGVMAGFHGAVKEGARALQAGAQLMGATDTAKSFSDFAEQAHAREQSYARADLEAAPWYSPTGIGYQISRMAPVGAVAVGGSLAAAALAPEAAVGVGAAALTGAARTAAIEAAKITARRYGVAGASAAMYPFVTGANVEREITERGQLTHPGRALALGVPEAILQGWLPGHLEQYFGKGVISGIAHSAAAQGVAGGGTELLTQFMGDPNRGFADRAAAVGHSALGGAFLGGVIGGAFGGMRALVGKPAARILDDPKAAGDAIDRALDPQGQLPLEGGGVRQGQPQGELPFPEPRTPPTERQLPLFGVPGVQTDLFLPEAVRAAVHPAGEMLWRNRDSDIPVTVVNEPPMAGPDGRLYQRVKYGDRESFVPADELVAKPPPAPPPAAPGPVAPELPLVGGAVRQGQPQGELLFPEARTPPTERQLPLFGLPGAQLDLFQPEGVKGPLQGVPDGALGARIDVLTPPRTQAEAVEVQQLRQEQQRRAAEADLAGRVPGQKLLPAPSIKEGPPLQEMDAKSLMDRWHYVQQWFDINPTDPRARRAYETTGQEVARRSQEMGPTWATPTVTAPGLPPLWDQARNIVEPAPPGQPKPEVPPAGAPVQMPAVPQGGELGRGAEVWKPPAAPEPVAPVEPAVPAAPVVDFAKQIRSQKAFDSKLAEIEALPLEAQVELQKQLAGLIAARGDKPLTRGPLSKWGRALDVLDEDGRLVEDFRPEKAPPEAPEVPPAAPVAAEPTAPTAPAKVKLVDENILRDAGFTESEIRQEQRAGTASTRAQQAAAGYMYLAGEWRLPTPEDLAGFKEGAAKDAEGYARDKKLMDERFAKEKHPSMGGILGSDWQVNIHDTGSYQAGAYHALENKYRFNRVMAGKIERQLERVPAAEPPPAEPVAPPVIVPAKAAPIKTHEDRVATLNGINEQLAEADPAIQAKHADEVKTVTRLIQNALTNPGAVLNATVRLTRLRNAVEADVQPLADAISTDLTPTPRAAAVPASAANFDKAFAEANRTLVDLKRVLPSAKEEALLHEGWLGEANDAVGPEEITRVLANDPEKLAADSDVISGFGDIPTKDLNPLQRQKLNAYLAAQQLVRQALEANSGPDAYKRTISSRDGLPVTHLDADVADHAVRGVKAVDTADHIIKNTPDAEQAALAQKLRDALPEDTKLVFRDGVVDKEGEYFPKQKLIVLYNAANSAVTFLHEVAHAVLSRALEGASAAARAMRGIYEQIKGDGDHAGITNVHEMVAEVYANPVYREWMKSKMVRGTSLWDRFIDAARGIIGLDPRLFNAFDRIMEHGDDLMREQKAYPNEWLGPDSYARAPNRALGAAAGYAEQIREGLSKQAENLDLPLKQSWRQIVYGAFTSNRIVDLIKPVISAAQEFYDTQSRQQPMEDALVTLQNREINKLVRILPPGGVAQLNRVLGMAAPNRLDPEKPLTGHTDILNDPLRTAAYHDLVDEFTELKKIRGGKEAYDAIRMNGSWQFKSFLTGLLQMHARAYPDLPPRDSHGGFVDRTDLRTIAKSEVYWDGELKSTMADMTAYRKKLSADQLAVDAAIAKKPPAAQLEVLRKQSTELGTKVDNIDTILKYVIDRQKIAAEAPYFHLPRSGSHFGTATLVKDTAGAIDRTKLAEFDKFLADNGFDDVVINPYGKNDTVYIKVNNAAAMRELRRTLLAAQDKGLLSQDAVGAGSATEIFDKVAPAAVQRVMAALKASRPEVPEGMDAKTAAAWNDAFNQQMQDMQRNLLNLTPENSISRLMAQRAYVQGFAKDMVTGQLDASKIMGRGITRMVLLPEISAGIAKMGAQVKEANHNKAISENVALSASDGVTELMRREYLRPTETPSRLVEFIRDVTHKWHVGASPIYGLMTLSQLGTTSLPELGKTHSYPAAAREMKNALPKTLQVLGAVMQSEDRFTVGITREALEKKNLPKDLIDETMEMVKRGDLGGYSIAMTEHAPFSNSTIWQALNSMGLYADLTPRLLTGYAARALYREKPVPGFTEGQFASYVIRESQGAFGPHTNPRYLSHMFGPMSPLVNQFMNWSAQMTGKIYQEVYNGFAGADAKTKTEARRWLAGHAAATTMLAGALGLPMLSTASTMMDWVLNNVTGKDDWNLQAAFRNFLADTFGKDMGEIIARGLPRAAGMDLARFGEADTLIGSTTLNMLFEKRKLEDRKSDWLTSMGGAGVGEAFNIAAAMRDFSNGDILDGWIKLSPNILKAPLQSYKLGAHGFVDSRGQPLPISSPRAYDIMLTALGIKPQREAEYHEVAREESGLRAMREASSANIGQHLRQAWMQGDPAAFNSWMQEAQQWQIDHPGFVPPHANFGRALSLHMRQLAIAKGMGLPIGVQPRDVTGRGLLQYGNIPMQ